MFDELGNVLPEQGERRVRHDDVSLVEKRHALRAPEVAVPLKLLD